MKGSKRVMRGIAWGVFLILAIGGSSKIYAAPTDELRVAISSFGKEKFEPHLITQTEQGVVAPMYDFLFRLDRNGNLAPGIIEKWEMAPDGLSWIFTVRKGVKFHNGDDLTARDVAYAYERYASPEADRNEIRDMVGRVEVVDNYAVRIYTKGLQLYLPYMSTIGQLGLVPPKAYIEKNGSEYFERHPVGSGPFKVVRYVRGDMIEFEALNKHWRQTPAFRHLKIILMPDESTRVAALKTGEVDIIDAGLEAVRELETAGFRTVPLTTALSSVQLYGTYYPEAAGMPTADIRVRQALSLAINRDEIRKTLFHEKAGPPTPPALHGKMTDIDRTYWRNYAAKTFRYDLNEAKRLLKEAGHPNGFDMKIYVTPSADGPYRAKLAEVIQAYWIKLGVKAEIVPVDRTRSRQLTTGGKDRMPLPELMGQAYMFDKSEGIVTPTELMGPFGIKGNRRLVGKAMPEFERLVEGALGEKDPMKRKQMLDTAIKMVTDSYTDISIATVPGMAVIGPRVDIDLSSPAPLIGFFLDLAKPRKQ